MHGINIADVVAGLHSVRHVLVLVGQLPEDSALLAAQLDREPITAAASKPRWRGWTYDRFLLADIRDALIAANWQRSGGKSRRPEPSSRPALKVPTGRDRLRSAARPPTSALRRPIRRAGG